MKKINFQDNVTKANAETMNLFQSNIEEAINSIGGHKGEIIECELPDNFEFSKRGTYNQIALIKTNQIGDGLSLTNNQIIVGKGISKIKITPSLRCQTQAIIELSIWVKSNEILKDKIEGNISGNNYIFTSLPSFVVNVTENSQITYQIIHYSSDGTNVKVFGHETRVLVEVLE